MRNITFKFFSCDFETSVYKGQVNTEVWASACVELFTEDVVILHSIADTFNYFKDLDCNICAYYHNLKFDGNFWMSFLLKDLHLEQAVEYLNSEKTSMVFDDIKNMKNNTFKYVISDMGQWYSITIKVNNHIIEIRDSLKLLPFSVKEIGNSMGTKHKKLDMEYKGFRYAGCEITDKEKEYIKNDVLVVKEALEIMFKEGHKQLTIGSCCLSEFKKTILSEDLKNWFPDLTAIELNKGVHTYDTVDKWIRKSYRGGWCYLVKGKENKVFSNGLTADVNSLYPSEMHSSSGNRYPIGVPKFWVGNYIPEDALKPNKYYFIRIKTRFYLKKGYLPFIQIKGKYIYKGTESLTTSDYYDNKLGMYCQYYKDKFGNTIDTKQELVLTMTDYELIKEHYELVDFEIIDGCYFYAQVGIFDEYLDKYKKIKMESKGAKRTLAKLFLNNLYGKMASSDDSSFKYAYLKDDNVVGFYNVEAHDKKAGYIAIGSAITSYARNFTIRHAQMNYHGENERGFIYADTDSIHCDLLPNEVVGLKIHKSDFNCWKLESYWDSAIFARQKTYIEHVTHEDGEVVDPYYNIKCAGMPQKCKNLLKESLTGTQKNKKEYTKEEQKFLYDGDEKIIRTLEDFKEGLIVPGKLLPKRIPGGVLLTETNYEMR